MKSFFSGAFKFYFIFALPVSIICFILEAAVILPWILEIKSHDSNVNMLLLLGILTLPNGIFISCIKPHFNNPKDEKEKLLIGMGRGNSPLIAILEWQSNLMTTLYTLYTRYYNYTFRTIYGFMSFLMLMVCYKGLSMTFDVQSNILLTFYGKTILTMIVIMLTFIRFTKIMTISINEK